MCRASSIDEVDYVAFKSGTSRLPLREQTPCKAPILLLILLILLSVGVHASKEALVPSEPALEKLGLSPSLYAILNILPVAFGLISPFAWGTLYDRSPSVCFICAPLGELLAATLTALGLHVLAEGGRVFVAGACLACGLLLSSACRPGITIAAFTTVGRVCGSNSKYSMFAFGSLVLAKHSMSSVTSWLVPLILQGARAVAHGGFETILHVQLAVMIPHAIALTAGVALAALHGPFIVPLADAFAEAAEATTVPGADSVGTLKPGPSAPSDDALYIESGRCDTQYPKGSKARREAGWNAVLLLGLWRALEVGTLHALHIMRVELTMALCRLSIVDTGRIIALNDAGAMAAMPLLAWHVGSSSMRRIFVLFVWIPVLSLAAVMALAADPGYFSVIDRVALFLISLLEVSAPVLPLALLPASVATARAGRAGSAYGVLESVFIGMQIGMIAVLGVLREGNPESFASSLAFTAGGFAAAAAVGLLLRLTL